MTLADLVTDSFRAYKGKSSSVPQAGSDKYIDIVAIANRKRRERAQDANVDWPDLYQNVAVGNAVTSTQTYNLAVNVLRPTDYVFIGTKQLLVIKSPAISRYTDGCYITGTNPKTLTFITTITTAYNGQAIAMPAIILPTDLVNASDVVNPTEAEWLVYATAAELARNDYAKEEQYGNISGQANDLYAKMVDTARASSFLQPNGAYNAMPQPSGLDYNAYSQVGF